MALSGPANANFVAHARTDIPALLNYIAALEEDLTACAEALVGARSRHYYCDDSWYSCPLAEGGCADEREPVDECRCGADERNAKIDASLARPGVQAVLGSSFKQYGRLSKRR